MNYHYLLFSCNVFEIQIQDILGQIAQSVEHGTENPGVAGSIPALPTKSRKGGCVQRYARPSPTRPRQNGFVGLANGFIRAGKAVLAGAGNPPLQIQ